MVTGVQTCALPIFPYSYFEALTAIAFLIFAARGVEVAALEVGLAHELVPNSPWRHRDRGY